MAQHSRRGLIDKTYTKNGFIPMSERENRPPKAMRPSKVRVTSAANCACASLRQTYTFRKSIKKNRAKAREKNIKNINFQKVKRTHNRALSKINDRFMMSNFLVLNKIIFSFFQEEI
jgi:hypothetical protein